jgi:hypothetical protein
MATIRLPPDFREFCEFLNSEKVEYLIVGGHAVGYYGYPRATGDLDVWVAVSPQNATALVRALHKFGFRGESISAELFLKEKQVITMGVPPLRIDVVTTISGVDFAACYAGRVHAVIDGVPVDFIALEHLKANKRASGRPKDQDDLQHLP